MSTGTLPPRGVTEVAIGSENRLIPTRGQEEPWGTVRSGTRFDTGAAAGDDEEAGRAERTGRYELRLQDLGGVVSETRY